MSVGLEADKAVRVSRTEEDHGSCSLGIIKSKSLFSVSKYIGWRVDWFYSGSYAILGMGGWSTACTSVCDMPFVCV